VTHFYLFDSFLGDRKYRPLVTRIESRLTELLVAGRMERLSVLKSASEMVREATKRGGKTVVAVGNDATVSKVLPAVVATGATLGYIPVGGSRIATLFGIPSGVAACDLIAKRMLARVDLGRANQTYFLFALEAPATGLVMELPGIAVTPRTADARIAICNVGAYGDAGLDGRCTATDGFLEAVVTRPTRSFSNFFRTKLEADTVLPVTSVKVKCPTDCMPLVADGLTVVKTPVTVEVVPRRLSVIVGKNRRIAHG
jgi:diacylglycerol kinase family enzyme